MDLEDNTGTRKFMKTKGEQYANEYLTEKQTYQLVIIKKNGNPTIFTIICNMHS